MKRHTITFVLLLALASCGTPAAPSANVAPTALTSPPTAISVATPTAAPTADTLIDSPANCTIAPNADKSDVQLGGPDFCVIWNDSYSDERGFQVVLTYPRFDKRFTYDVEANTTEFVIPASDRPSAQNDQCQRSVYIIEVYAILPNANASVGSLAVEAECRPAPTAAPTALTLIDPQQPLTNADDPLWQYQRAATADFDGDGVAERAVLIARVELVDGQPAWDDGQPWQMYIEEPDSTRTYVYARFLQMGTLEALLTSAAQGKSGIMLLERTPFTLAVYDVRYRGPQQAEVSEAVRRELDPAQGFVDTAE